MPDKTVFTTDWVTWHSDQSWYDSLDDEAVDHNDCKGASQIKAYRRFHEVNDLVWFSIRIRPALACLPAYQYLPSRGHGYWKSRIVCWRTEKARSKDKEVAGSRADEEYQASYTYSVLDLVLHFRGLCSGTECGKHFLLKSDVLNE